MNHHYPAIDGLRGFAAITVAVLHFVMYFPVPSDFHNTLYVVTGLGWTGVDLFFVISGFLITQILLSTRSGHNYFKKFYIRRTLRIFPLYYTFIIVLFFILPLFGIHSDSGRGWTWPYFFTYTQNYLNFNNIGFGPEYSGHFWSLAVEEQFYLVWPLVIYLFPPKVLAKIFPVFIIISVIARWLLRDIIGSNGLDMLALTFTRADGLLMGGWIAFMLWRGWSVTLPRVSMQIVISILCVGFFAAITFGLFDTSPFANHWGGVDDAIWIFVINFIYALLLLAAIGPPNFIQKAFSNRPLRWLGKYSYAIYVFHFPVMRLLMENVDFTKLLHSLGSDDPVLGILMFIAVAMILTITAALISWNILEKPFLSLKKYFPYDKPRNVMTEQPSARNGVPSIEVAPATNL